MSESEPRGFSDIEMWHAGMQLPLGKYSPRIGSPTAIYDHGDLLCNGVKKTPTMERIQARFNQLIEIILAELIHGQQKSFKDAANAIGVSGKTASKWYKKFEIRERLSASRFNIFSA